MNKYDSLEKAQEYIHMAWKTETGSASPSVPFYDLIKKIISQNLRNRKKRHGLWCVEIGFGSGRTLFDLSTLIKGGHIIGIEKSAAMIEMTKLMLANKSKSKKYRNIVEAISLNKGDAERIELPNGLADLVISVNVLDRVQETKKAIAELVRIAKTGGLLVVVSAFDYENLTTPKQNRLSLFQVKEILKKLNCSLVQMHRTKLVKKINKKHTEYNEVILVLNKN